MSGWPRTPLGELCEVNIGRTPARDRPEFWGDGHPWLSIADMNQGRDVRRTKESITDVGVSTCNCKVVAPDTVLLSFKLSIGKVGIAKIPLYTNEAIAALPIRQKDRLLPDYLYRALSFVDLTAGLDRAAKGLTLNKPKLLSISIPLAPLPEQRRIAAILDKADELRAKRRAALEQLNGLTQAMFLEMFGDPAINSRRWPLTTLRDLCAAVIDCPHSTPVYSSERTPFACVRSSDIQNSELTLREAKFVEKAEYDKRIGCGKPNRGDVIYCREGARFGNAARLNDDIPVCLGQRMMLFRPAQDKASSEYVWAFLSSPSTYRQASRAVGGSAAPHVNIREIAAFQVPTPPRDLQREFSGRVNAVDGVKSAHSLSLIELDALFASLQHQAFSGAL